MVETLFSNESRLPVEGVLNAELAHPAAKGVGMEIRRPAMDFEGSFSLLGAQFGGDLFADERPRDDELNSFALAGRQGGQAVA